MWRGTKVALFGRLSGTIVSWHPFERRGVIRSDSDGKEYTILNARSFETILPTNLRHLNGAKVEFEAFCDEKDLDRVITRNRLEPITAESYARTSPVDFLAGFLAGFRLEQGENKMVQQPSHQGPSHSASSLSPSTLSQSPKPPLRLFAGNIKVNFGEPASVKGGSATLDAEGEKEIAGEESKDGEEGTRPPLGVKDLRNASVLDEDTKDLLRLRRLLGDEAKARETLQQQRVEAQVARAQQRKVIATHQTGVVLAWSSMYRSGVVLENATELPKCAINSCTKEICIIRNVDAFDTALPTALNLVGCVVSFAKVAYASDPLKFFAENICVCGEIQYDEAKVAATNTKKAAAAAAEHSKRAKQLGTLFNEMDFDYENEPPPAGPLYGVVTRWSGGQGTVETANRRMYYIQSAADFNQLVDHSSTVIRGAVVSFKVDSENYRNAREVDILSLATKNVADVMPMLKKSVEGLRKPLASAKGEKTLCGGSNRNISFSGGDGGSAVVEEASEEPQNDVAWVHGVLVTWSSVENQGIIEDDDGNRYLLRDGEEHVRDYKKWKPFFKKGRRVKFTSFGSSGRLACNVVPLDAEADDATNAEAELRPDGGRCADEGPAEEAIASPMSTSYWISRMDRAGYDTTEVKKMQNKAITFEEDDDDDDKLLDSEDLFKKDHWFNDPRKNIRFPNSDVTAGNLALIGPASMMNIAMKVRDPRKLENAKNKYYNRLTEPMKEFAWKQAKELAPKYEKRIKEAREKGHEPRFSFY